VLENTFDHHIRRTTRRRSRQAAVTNPGLKFFAHPERHGVTPLANDAPRDARSVLASGAPQACGAPEGGLRLIGSAVSRTREKILHMESVLGPPVYENWKAHANGASKIASFEYPLFTDSRVVGADADFGPFMLLNPQAGNEPTEFSRSALVLRYHLFINMMMYYERLSEKTDVSLYHGGQVTDEIAALLSLTSGMRLKAGGESRRFDEGDPAGRPVAWDPRKNPELFSIHGDRVINPVVGVFVANRELLYRIPHMSVDDALTLIRAARLYQDAIWIAESEPNLSWVMLVSAVETAAIRWRAAKEPAEQRLEADRPELAQRLRDLGGDDAVRFVAEAIAESLGSTRKFIDFTLEFLPDAPPKRPLEGSQSDWTPAALKKSLSIIYGYRSLALHAGRPFPAPMCRAPFSEAGWDAPAERPVGDIIRSMGGTWRSKDLPFYLHMFNYIARWSLLNWWKSVAG